MVSSSTRTRWCAARAWRPPPARASAIAERFGRAAPGRSPAPGGPWSGFCVPLPSPTGAQRSPLCLRRPRPARGGTSAAGSSSSGSRRIVRPLGAQPAAAAEGSPDPAQGSQRSSEAAVHELPACHRWLRGRGRGRRGRWGTCWGDFGGSAARSRTRVVSCAAIFQVAARLIFASKWSLLCCSIRPGPAWTDPRRRESRSGHPGPRKYQKCPNRAPFA